MAQGYSQVFMRYFTQLVKCLPMDDPLFIAELSTANLLPGNMQPTIQSLTTKVDKSSYFLNNVIKPALDSNFTDSFDNLLNIMEKCEFSFVKQLAISIKADITPTNGHGTGGQQHHGGPTATATTPVSTSFDFAAASAKITANYVELTELPINSILGALRGKKVILPRQKEEIEAISLPRNRMEHLLDNIITPSLNIKVCIKFKGLLEVMEQSDDLMFHTMAQKLGGSAAVPSS